MYWTVAKGDIDNPLMCEYAIDLAINMAESGAHARLSVDSQFEEIILSALKSNECPADSFTCYLPSIRNKGLVIDNKRYISAYKSYKDQNDKGFVFSLGLSGVDLQERSSLVSVSKLLGDKLNAPSSFLLLAEPFYECDERGQLVSVDGESQEEFRMAQQMGMRCYNLHIEQHRNELQFLIKNMEWKCV